MYTYSHIPIYIYTYICIYICMYIYSALHMLRGPRFMGFVYGLGRCDIGMAHLIITCTYVNNTPILEWYDYKYTRLPLYTPVHIHICIHVRNTCMCCICIHVHVCVRVCLFTHICVCVHTSIKRCCVDK